MGTILNDEDGALQIWAEAHIIANDNPRLLLLPDRDYSEICIGRMKKLKDAERLLAQLREFKDIRPELKRWFEIEDDRACVACSASSTMENMHPECITKINRYFDYRLFLILFAISLDPVGFSYEDMSSSLLRWLSYEVYLDKRDYIQRTYNL